MDCLKNIKIDRFSMKCSARQDLEEDQVTGIKICMLSSNYLHLSLKWDHHKIWPQGPHILKSDIVQRHCVYSLATTFRSSHRISDLFRTRID